LQVVFKEDTIVLYALARSCLLAWDGPRSQEQGELALHVDHQGLLFRVLLWNSKTKASIEFLCFLYILNRQAPPCTVTTPSYISFLLFARRSVSYLSLRSSCTAIIRERERIVFPIL